MHVVRHTGTTSVGSTKTGTAIHEPGYQLMMIIALSKLVFVLTISVLFTEVPTISYRTKLG